MDTSNVSMEENPKKKKNHGIQRLELIHIKNEQVLPDFQCK